MPNTLKYKSFFKEEAESCQYWRNKRQKILTENNPGYTGIVFHDGSIKTIYNDDNVFETDHSEISNAIHGRWRYMTKSGILYWNEQEPIEDEQESVKNWLYNRNLPVNREATFYDEIDETMDTPPPTIIQHANQPKPSNIINREQLYIAYIIAATLYGEAKSEGEVGMQAVLNVIMNRSHQDFNKAKNIVLKPKQFSTWNGVHNPEKVSIELAKQEKNNQIYRTAIKLVDLAMKGKLPDITGGATLYYNPKEATPFWAGRPVRNKKIIKTKEIGNHKFYKVPKRLKEEQQIKSDLNNISTTKQGLVDDSIYGYEIKSPYSYLRYRHEPSTNIFYFDNVGTPKEDDTHKGYAKELMEVFFKLVKDKGGAVDMGAYTTSGMMYVKPVAERLAKQYNVRLVTGRKYDKT